MILPIMLHELTHVLQRKTLARGDADASAAVHVLLIHSEKWAEVNARGIVFSVIG